MKDKSKDQSKYELWIDPAQVKPYERNVKIHTDKQIENICTSIRRFGWQQDTVLTSDNVLVIGHGRRLAALKLGCLMPYHRIDKAADELTDKDIRELRIADNQTNAETGLDFAELEAELDGLTFEGFDFDFMSKTEAEGGVNNNPTEALPDSKVYVFSISSFGTASECFFETELLQEEADRLIERSKEIPIDEICEKIRGVLRDL